MFKYKNSLIVGNSAIDLERGYRTLVSLGRLSGDENSTDNSLAKAYQSSVWAYRCIRIRAETLSSVNWEIHKNLKNGNNKTLDFSDDLPTLLREVNPENNWIDLIRATEADLLIYGKAYWLKVRGQGSRTVVALMRLNPSTIKVNATSLGIESFEQNLGSGREVFPREDIVYFKDYHPVDDLNGLSPSHVALASISQQVNAEKYISAFFENYAVPPLFLTTEQDIPQAEMSRIKAWWDRTFKGGKNQHKTAFADKGLKPTVIGYPLNDLALKDVEETARRNICAAFGVPPAIAGAWEAANYAASAEQRLSLYQDTIIPRAQYLASVINSELIQSEFGADLEFIWLFDEIQALQEDKNQEAQRLALLVEKGIIKPEVAAEKLGFSVEDVPQKEAPEEPEEVEEAPDQELVTPKASRSIEVDEDDKDFIKEDLRKWYIKSKKRLASGKSAVCTFESEFIPPTLMESIKAQLEQVECQDDLVKIFDSASHWLRYP